MVHSSVRARHKWRHMCNVHCRAEHQVEYGAIGKGIFFTHGVAQHLLKRIKVKLSEIDQAVGIPPLYLNTTVPLRHFFAIINCIFPHFLKFVFIDVRLGRVNLFFGRHDVVDVPRFTVVVVIRIFFFLLR